MGGDFLIVWSVCLLTDACIPGTWFRRLLKEEV
jgi:hypothetical protein